MKAVSIRFILILLLAVAALSFSVLPTASASAHEVYVLESEEIQKAIEGPRLDISSILKSDEKEILIWSFIIFAVVTLVFFLSISQVLERFFDPLLFKLKPFASYYSASYSGSVNSGFFVPRVSFRTRT